MCACMSALFLIIGLMETEFKSTRLPACSKTVDFRKERVLIFAHKPLVIGVLNDAQNSTSAIVDLRSICLCGAIYPTSALPCSPFYLVQAAGSHPSRHRNRRSMREHPYNHFPSVPAPLGAGSFVWSSAIGDHQPIAGNIREMFFNRIGRNTDRLRQFCLCFGPRFRTARVSEKNILA